MTRWLDKLNLRPQERKLVIFVAVVVFVALNWFFVKPYFGELGRIQQRMRDADTDLVQRCGCLAVEKIEIHRLSLSS